MEARRKDDKNIQLQKDIENLKTEAVEILSHHHQFIGSFKTELDKVF